LTEDDITELCNHEDPGQDDILDADPDAWSDSGSTVFM
jgi:hypothetical protein